MSAPLDLAAAAAAAPSTIAAAATPPVRAARRSMLPVRRKPSSDAGPEVLAQAAASDASAAPNAAAAAASPSVAAAPRASLKPGHTRGSSTSSAAFAASASAAAVAAPPKPLRASLLANNPKRATWSGSGSASSGESSASAAGALRPALAGGNMHPHAMRALALKAARPAASINPLNPPRGIEAHLASLVALREAKLREERRRKPAVKERLSATFSLSKQVALSRSSAASAPAAVGAPLTQRPGDLALQASMPHVFSVLGGNSVDCIRRAFGERGWVENKDEWSGLWTVQWAIIGRTIRFDALRPGQIVNHLQGAHCLTSKSGLCASISEARWADRDPASFFPQCHALHVHEQEGWAEFVQAFRTQSAFNVAWRFLRAHERSNRVTTVEPWVGGTEVLHDPGLFPPATMQLTLVALRAHARRQAWEKDGIDNALPTVPPSGGEGGEWADLTEQEWDRVLALADELTSVEKARAQEEAIARHRATKEEVGAAASPAADDGSDGEGDERKLDPSASDDECKDAEAAAEDDGAAEDERDHDRELAAIDEPSRGASASPSPDASTDDAEQQAEQEESSFSSPDSLALLSRTPMDPLALAQALADVLAFLREVDSQQASLVGPEGVNLWILKPGGLSRGRGIRVVADLPSIRAVLKTGGRWVCQKYIERPLLVWKKKFDVRQWVLVSTFSSVLSVWFYSAGAYIRFSSEDYSPHVLDGLVHLTNNSVQKHGQGFDTLEFAKGNMWSTAQFEEWLEKNEATIAAPSAADSSSPAPRGSALWAEHIQPAMKSIARDVVSCGQVGLDHRANSFTLFGLDYMISADLRPWLIEVNSSPTLVGISVPGLVESLSRDIAAVVTTDPWSPASDEYRERVRAEKERLAESAAAEAEAVAAVTATTKPAAGARAFGGTVKSTAAAPSTSLQANPSAPSDPFLLPTPHPVGHRVGGFEVLSSSFIGVVPKSHRTKLERLNAAPMEEERKENSEPASKDKKAAPAQPSGLFVTGKAMRTAANSATAPAIANKRGTAVGARSSIAKR